MKKIIIVLVIIMNYSVYSQLSSEDFDVRNGSSIEFLKFITPKKNHLFINRGYPREQIYGNVDGIMNVEDLYFPLKETKTKDSIFKQTRIKRGIESFYTFNIFDFKKSGMDNSYQNLHFVYNNEIMTIKIQKNFAGVRLIFKEFKFKEGVFEIDLKKIAKEKLYKNKKMPKHTNREFIYINTFPFEE